MSESSAAAYQPLGRSAMAARVARDIPEGWYVNLGIGIPTLVSNHVPLSREVVFHSENGVIGVGPAPPPEAVNPWLINASSQHVTLRPGGSYIQHADSFAVVRGGHLDLCVLGAYQVAENGDLANWARSEDDTGPQIGGAMDLAVGARRVWAVMEHTTREGKPRLVHRCSYPLTAKAAVSRVYTNLAVLDVTPEGFVAREMIAGLSLAGLQARTGAPVRFEKQA
ncbi:MAG: 3-oxoacid CoA-transferase subunit B [Acidisphaera sp.]|nr:3-oxoacid CoA-transferase subunit B [Acidisphaera sp.]